ncbi:MAG: hypothetical protein WC227_00880 [Patescibacteria group bacterium]|jgi:hypothetical protein
MKLFKNNIKRVGSFKLKDFELVKNHYLARASELNRLINGSNKTESLAENSKRAYYLHCFIDDMRDLGYPEIADGLEEALAKRYHDPKILLNIAEAGLSRILSSFEGKIRLGENEYHIRNGKAYYQSVFDKWYELKGVQVFLLTPDLGEEVVPIDAEGEKGINEYQTFLRAWRESGGRDNFDFSSTDGDTTPENYFESSVNEISKIIETPISSEAILAKIGSEQKFERIFKVAARLIKFVKEIRDSGVSPVYLLRDGLMFAEAQKALDFASGQDTLSGQLMINRKLLSKEPDDHYYWALASDALYVALPKNGRDFDLFYKNYCQEMARLKIKEPGFKELLSRLGLYVSSQLSHLKGSKKILVVDTGLQGSINMLTKYVIDFHTDLDVPVDVEMFVVGDWLKRIYQKRYASDYYPILKDIEIFNRSDHLYNYRSGSFESGKVEVTMGSEAEQLMAHVELIIITMLCKLMDEQKSAPKVSPAEAASGGMANQYSLDGFKLAKTLADPSKPLTSHTVELWENHQGERLVVKTVSDGLEHSLSADIIGQRCFTLLGLPSPRTSLIEHDDKYRLVMEFLDGYKTPDDPLALPLGQENNRVIQSGILADIWLHHYDRQPYNFMFKGDEPVFIDFGGCLTSSPSGKITGFPAEITDQEILNCIKAFQGDYPVNQAYGEVISFNPSSKKIVVKDAELLARLADQLSKVSDEQIEAIVSQNILFFQKHNPDRIQHILDNLEENLKIPIEKLHYAHYHNNFLEARDTFARVRDEFDSDESNYIQFALKQRRDMLVKRFK